jgi:hypothetical protein
MSASLREFAKWFLSQPMSALRPPRSAIYQFDLASGVVQSIVLYRLAPFQVELISGLPIEGWQSKVNRAVPEHSHPNVDSIEYVLAGQIAFTICGQQIAGDEDVNGIAEDGASSMCGKRMHIKPNVPHGAAIGASGAVFLSIQEWKPGIELTSVGVDWDGPAHIATRLSHSSL